MKTRIRELRTSKKMTQTALGLSVGYAQNTISKIESGKVVPNAEILCKIADYFHTSVDYLLYRSEQRYTTIAASLSIPHTTQYLQKLNSLSPQAQNSIYYLLVVIMNSEDKE